MSEFGTGLRAHLEVSRGGVVQPEPATGLTPDIEAMTAVLEAERRRLDALAAQLASKEMELAEREAELHTKQEQMAVNLAQALIQAHTASGVETELPVDELAAYRARRFGT